MYLLGHGPWTEPTLRTATHGWLPGPCVPAGGPLQRSMAALWAPGAHRELLRALGGCASLREPAGAHAAPGGGTGPDAEPQALPTRALRSEAGGAWLPRPDRTGPRGQPSGQREHGTTAASRPAAPRPGRQSWEWLQELRQSGAAGCAWPRPKSSQASLQRSQTSTWKGPSRAVPGTRWAALGTSPSFWGPLTGRSPEAHNSVSPCPTRDFSIGGSGDQAAGLAVGRGPGG